MFNLAQETLDIFKRKYYYLSGNEITLQTEYSSKLYKEEDLNNIVLSEPKYTTNVTVIKETSIAASLRALSKACIICTANPKTPGGDFLRGGTFKEENLCYVSNLYLSLNEQKEFYSSNNAEKSEVIYSKDLTLIRNETHQLIKYPKQVDIISCVSLDNRIYHDEGYLVSKMRNKLRNCIKAAIDNNIEILILGAFGCGHLKHNPELISKIAKSLIYKEGWGKYFSEIIFAIVNKTNYQVFKDTFEVISLEPKSSKRETSELFNYSKIRLAGDKVSINNKEHNILEAIDILELVQKDIEKLTYQNLTNIEAYSKEKADDLILKGRTIELDLSRIIASIVKAKIEDGYWFLT